ncbi:MAG: Ig-like domain-containing protein [Pseudomonadota bacterium]
MTILNDSGLSPAIAVNVNGVGRDPNPTEIPTISVASALDFGNLAELASATRGLIVSNTGNAPLTISSLSTSDSSANAAPLIGDLPLVINAGGSRTVQVTIQPPSGTEGTLYNQTLTIISDDPAQGSRAVSLTANVSAAQPAVDLPIVSTSITGNSIDAANCASIDATVSFSEESTSSDTVRVSLTDQAGTELSSASASAPEGPGSVPVTISGACALIDGVIEVRAILDRPARIELPAYFGSLAVKNTSPLAPPVLDPVEPVSLLPTVEVCGTSRANTTVKISGGTSVVAATLDALTASFCLDVPLRPNTQNTLIASAVDDLAVAPRPLALAVPVPVVQVTASDIVIADVTSEPLTEDEIAELVDNGVIDLNDPSNFNVSVFTIVFTVGSFPVTVSEVLVVPVDGSPGTPVTGGSSNWTVPPVDGDPLPCDRGCTTVVVADPGVPGATVPGVIIIDGRIRTLRELFQITVAILNSSGSFNLTDVDATLNTPGGLTPLAAGPGSDVGDVNDTGDVTGLVLGTIAPGETGTGQFVIRGDSIGSYGITVDYDGFITDGGLPDPVAFNGSVGTSVEVFGPPELGVVVRHPSDPFGPDVELNEIYPLVVEITNESSRPAFFTSLDLFVGGNSRLVDETGIPLPDGNDVRDFGTIPPGGTVAATFRVESLVQGELIACQAVASDNISLTIDSGPDGTDCNVANTIPANFEPLPVDAPPTVFGINPLNGQPNNPVTTSILATLTPETACLTPDTWQNVVTEPIGGDPANGFEIVSADFVSAGSFYLEEIDAFGRAVAHIPTDLIIENPPTGGTTIATLRLGLASPLSQVSLKSNTTYRATLVGADRDPMGAVCNASTQLKMENTFEWTFSTEQNCASTTAPAVTLSTPSDGAIDRPLNQSIVLDFSNRMDLTTFALDPMSLANSTFGVYQGALESGGDISGGVAVPGAAAFTDLGRSLTFTPQFNLADDTTIHVRLTDGIADECGNPLATPPVGVRLFSFDTAPTDSTSPAGPLVNPVPVLTGQPTILVSGRAEPSSNVSITGGATGSNALASESGLFAVNVPLLPDQSNVLSLTATDASGNTSAPPTVDDVNGGVLVVFYDATPPALVSSTPANGETDVARTSTISAVFNEPLQPGTINTLNVVLNGPSGNVNGTLTVDGDTSFTFAPDAPLAYGTPYALRVRSNGITDVAGRVLDSDITINFTTELPPAPVLTSVLPDTGQQGETLNVTFSGTFPDAPTTLVSDEPGVTGSITSIDGSTVEAQIIIDLAATLGATTLGLSNAGGTASLPFTITPRPPSVTSISPGQGSRGTTLAAQIVGDALTGITDIAIDGSGVTITDLGTGDDTTRDVEIAIDSDAPLGARTVTVTTSAGSANGDFTVAAGVGHYWRFEQSGFLADSLGSAALTTFGSPAQVSVPDGLRGVDFPAILDVTAGGPNGDAGSLDGNSGFQTVVSSGTTDNFTIEALVNFDELTGGFARTIAGANRNSNINDWAWHLQVRVDGAFGTVPGELSLIFNTDTGVAPLGSDIVLTPGVDYYVAVSFDLAGGQAVFYVQDLTNGTPLQLATVAHSVTSVDPSDTFYIGGPGFLCLFCADGLIDEVRLSDAVLAQSELLISNAINPVITLTPSSTIGLTRADIPLTVNLDMPAGPGGQSIAITSDEPSFTVPANVTVLEGATTASLNVTTGTVGGSGTITASAPGFVDGTSLVTAQLRTMNLSFGLIGLGQTTPASVTLSQPAPSGGVTIAIASDMPAIADVNTTSVFIAEGTTSAGFNLIGGTTIGTAQISADAVSQGFELETRTASVTNRQIDLPANAELALGESLIVPILISPDPADAGGADISITSTDSAVVDVLTPLVTIAEGAFTTEATIQALAPGQVTITAANAGYLSDSFTVDVTAEVSAVLPSTSFMSTESADVYFRLLSGGDDFAATSSVDFTVSSSDATCVTASSPATVAVGDFFASASVNYGGTASIPCTATVTVNNAIFGSASMDVTVEDTTPDLGTMSISAAQTSQDLRIGAGLQALYRVTVSDPNHGGIDVLLTSDDPSRLRLASDSVLLGAPVLTVNIPNGSTSAQFFAQGVTGGLGMTGITATQERFSDGTVGVEVVAPVFAIFNLASSATTLSADDPFTVGTYILNASGTALQRNQSVAGASALSVSVASSDGTVGQLVTAAVPDGATAVHIDIQPGEFRSSNSVANGGVALSPVGSGIVDVVASAAGFAAFPVNDTFSVAVSQPGITLQPSSSQNQRIGGGLQAAYRVLLGGADHGGVTVQIDSLEPSKVLLSTDSATAGSASIGVSIADGQTAGTFWVQGVPGATGTVTLSATESLFATDTYDVEIGAPVLAIFGLGTSTTTLSADASFTVWTYTPNTSGTGLQSNQAVAGGSSLSVSVTSSDTAVGQLVTTAVPGGGSAVTVEIQPGQSRSPTSVASGGVAFDPTGDGTVDVVASAAGFTAFPINDTISVAVSQPSITLQPQSSPNQRVGGGLQAAYRVVLGGADHGGVTVQIDSADPSTVVLSTDSTTAGSASIGVSIADGQTSGTFWVQGVSGATGTATLSASEPQFATGTFDVEIVAPVLAVFGLGTSTTTLSADTPFSVWTYTPTASGTGLQRNQAVAGGSPLSVSVTSSDTAVGQLVTTAVPGGGAAVTVDIAPGQSRSPVSVAGGGVAFDPTGNGTVDVVASATGFTAFPINDTISVAVSQPSITLQPQSFQDQRIGGGLQAAYRVVLGGADHGGVTVQIDSPDPSTVLLSTDSITAGSASIGVSIADGQTSGTFWVQGVSGTTGTATLSASEPQFATGTYDVEIVTPVLAVFGLGTSTTTLSADTPFSVWTYTPNASGTGIERNQLVAGGSALSVSVTSSDTAAGRLVTTAVPGGGSAVTVDIQPGQSRSPSSVASGGVAFDPVGIGTVDVIATANGFSAFPVNDTISVTVSQPGIALQPQFFQDQRIGGGLQAQYRVTLGGADHGGIDVRIGSSDPAIAVVSSDPFSPGTPFVDISVPDGQTQTTSIYVQGISANTGTVTLTASSAQFTSGTFDIEVVTPVLQISGLNPSGTVGVDDPFRIFTYIPDTTGILLQRIQPVSGAGDLTITATSTDAVVGPLVTTAMPGGGGSVNVTIPAGQTGTASNVAAGGVQLSPAAAGSTTVQVTASGFGPFPSADTQAVTVAQ